MPTAADTVREYVDAMRAGAPHDHFAAAGFRYVGRPFAGLVVDLDQERSPDGASARMAAAGVRVRFGEVQAAGPGRAWVEVVWTHDAGNGHGSAGLQWVVFEVQDGLVREVRFFQEREAARRFAFHDPGG